jgi:nucleotide-binding universal stress UspA family protein
MHSNILVAVDGSEASRHALAQAVELARRLAARLHIVHVVDMGWLPLGPEVAIDIDALSAARRNAGEKILAEACDEARKAGFEVDAALIETGTPDEHVAEAIAGEAARRAADLLILGSHGRRGFQRLMLGSVAERAARLSPVPVLLVPSPKAPSPA